MVVTGHCVTIAASNHLCHGETLTRLHSFVSGDAQEPKAERLIRGADGNFYGTTSGGYNNKGTVFKMTPAELSPPSIRSLAGPTEVTQPLG